jgi:protoporphyrinogen oxidase
LIEAAPAVGGLARSINVAGEEIEAYYHHVFPDDRELRDSAADDQDADQSQHDHQA